jgi:hypothetical protein
VLRALQKATGVGAEYSLESGINWSSRWELSSPSTRAGFHHGRVGGHFEYEKSLPTKKRKPADDQGAKKSRT